MKNYKQLIKELPSKKVVFAFGRFQPPTTGHELLVKAVKKLAGTTADHVIYASKTEDKKSNPLPVDRKVYYLKRMFPKTNFVAANAQVRTFMEAAKELNKKYKNIVMVAGSDRVAAFTKFLNDYNGKDFHFDSIEVVSAGERDPDSDSASGMSGTKMREAAKKGDFELFKKGVPHTLTDLDTRRLMNDIRKGMGLEIIKEQVQIERNELREQYFNGEIFNVGDLVLFEGAELEIVKRGSNHLLLKTQDGTLVSKWIQDVQLLEQVEEEQMNEELTDKTLKVSDKIKVARIIADAFGVENAEAGGSPETLVNAGLRKVKSKPFTADSLKIIANMLHLAAEVGIKYDNNLVPTKLKEGTIQPNGTDKIDVLSPDRTRTVYYKDFKKIQKEAVSAADRKDNESDQDYEADAKSPEETETGNSLHAQTTLRRQKVKYHLGESFDAAQKHKDKALEAQKKGDSEGYHHHMSNHHEEMGKWHEDKGRHSMADISFKKAEDHHETSIRGGEVKNEAVEEEPAQKHRIAVIVSDPSHTAVSKRKDQMQKFAKVTADSQESAIKKATEHYKKLGMKVHSAEHHSMVKEDLDEAQSAAVKLQKAFQAELEKAKKERELGQKVLATPKKEELDPQKTTEETKDEMDSEGDYQKPRDRFFESEEGEPHVEWTDKEIDDMINNCTDDDYMEVYDDKEFQIVDIETGEEIKEESVNEQALDEVLSRTERMRAKMRFAKTKSKRERKMMIALHRRSDTKTLNKRARHMAVNLMKQKLAKKPLSQLSVGEKERIERQIERRKAIINRIAMKMTPRIRKIEQDRLSHKTATK